MTKEDYDNLIPAIPEQEDEEGEGLDFEIGGSENFSELETILDPEDDDRRISQIAAMEMGARGTFANEEFDPSRFTMDKNQAPRESGVMVAGKRPTELMRMNKAEPPADSYDPLKS